MSVSSDGPHPSSEGLHSSSLQPARDGRHPSSEGPQKRNQPVLWVKNEVCSTFSIV